MFHEHLWITYIDIGTIRTDRVPVGGRRGRVDEAGALRHAPLALRVAARRPLRHQLHAHNTVYIIALTLSTSFRLSNTDRSIIRHGTPANISLAAESGIPKVLRNQMLKVEYFKYRRMKLYLKLMNSEKLHLYIEVK